MTDFTKEARDAMRRLSHDDGCAVELITDADYPCDCGLDVARAAVEMLARKSDAGVAEGMAKAAEIARVMPTCVLKGNMTFTTTPRMVAEAILAAAPQP